MRLTGKVALVTGGGAGIGRACVELFAREGAAVVVAELDAASGEAACAAASAAGGRVRFVRTDVSDPDSVANAVACAVSAFGGLDVLYNNVGGSTPQDGPVHETSLEEFHRKMSVDVFGTWLGCRHAIPEMTRRGGGAIVNASSICGLLGIPGKAAYSAAKGAVTSLTRAMAVDCAPLGIRVNAVAPGITLTPRVAARHDHARPPTAMEQRHLLGLLDPLDVAHAVLFLASDEARRITGQVLAVDSGMTIT